MAIKASGARHSLAYGVQTDFDTVQTDLIALRQTGVTLAPSADELESSEVSGNRQVLNSRKGMKKAAGDINFELSHGTYDGLLSAICGADWAANAKTIAASTISATASTNTMADSGDGFTFSVGEFVQVACAFTTENDGIYKVTAATAGSITLQGKPLGDMSAGESVTITGLDTLKVGSSEKYLTVQRHFEDIDKYEVYQSCAVNSMSLSVKPNEISTGSFNMVAKDMTLEAVDASPDHGTSTKPISGIDVGNLYAGDAMAAYVTGVELSIEGNVEAKPVLGSNAAGYMVWTDNFRVTAKLDATFEDDALMNAFLGETESNLRVALVDLDGNTFGFDLPRIKYTSGGRPTSDRSEITQTPDIKALYDETDATTITFFRLAA